MGKEYGGSRRQTTITFLMVLYTDPESHLEGPILLHYRSSALKDVIQRQKDCWQTIVTNSVEVPSQTISIYDRDGEVSRTIHTSTTLEDALSSPRPTSSSTATEAPSLDSPPADDTSETGLPINKTSEQIMITDPEAHNSPELELEAVNPPCDPGHTNTPTLSSGPELQSKLCKAIGKVIGTIQQDNLLKLDSLHIHLKQLKQINGRVSANDKKVYNELLGSFRTLVLGRRAFIQTELTAYEKQYYKENSRLLTTDNTQFRELLSQRNYANKLLQSWSISL